VDPVKGIMFPAAVIGVPHRSGVRIFFVMSRLEVRPIEAADVPDAAALLAQRHRRHRSVRPLLSVQYEHDDAAAAEVSAALAREGASGSVALRDGKLVGFLVGAPKPNEVWGPNVWIEAAGHAVTEAETARELYAVAAGRWVEEGRTAHYVIVPATDPDLVRAWFRLGFGHQQTHGLRGIPTTPPAPAKVTVRRATRDDIPTLAELDLELPRHQGLAPTFSAGKIGLLADRLAEWEVDIDSPDFTTFVAVRDGEVIGSAVGCAIEQSGAHVGLSRPDKAGFLGFAAVFGRARGIGAGRALGEAVLAWTAESGFDSVVTDWRTTNLLSSRAWPALGFAESFVRLHRLIGY
jgi:GNAT superfamily N-acetyltransferase